MDETEAYDAGRAAFLAGDDWLSCPVPAPYSPPRTEADAAATVTDGGTPGSFWLDGYQAAMDSEPLA